MDIILINFSQQNKRQTVFSLSVCLVLDLSIFNYSKLFKIPHNIPNRRSLVHLLIELLPDFLFVLVNQLFQLSCRKQFASLSGDDDLFQMI